MNGWQRLWVVICALSLMGAIAYGWETIPRRAEILERHSKQFDPDNLTEKKWELKLTNPDPETRELARGALEKIKAFKEHIHKVNEKELEDLASNQMIRFLTIAGIWLGSSITLYVAGWILGWIYRGFRPQKA